jgi:hypothetical protein
MKTKSKWVALAVLACMLTGMQGKLSAQTDSNAVVNSPSGGAEKFLLAGEVFTLWQSNKVKGLPSNNTFGANPLGLMLMPLVKLSNRLFLDVQVGVAVNPAPGGGAGISLNEAIIYYRLCPSAYIFAGNFQPRTGLYEGILDDFTNRYGTSPVGMGIAMGTQSGIGIQGGFQAGFSKILYQLYVANGPQLVVDSTGATNGQMTYGNYIDNNLNKCVGGTLGILPFSNSCLEIGVSGQYTPKTGDAGSPFEGISNTAFAAYLNYYHSFGKLMIRAQGQYEMNQTQSYNLYRPGTNNDSILPGSGFTNQMTGWYGGLTFRLAGSQNMFLSNLELGARISSLTPPVNALWGGQPINQYTICLTYWFTWKIPINIAYDMYKQNGAPDMSTITVRGMWFF